MEQFKILLDEGIKEFRSGDLNIALEKISQSIELKSDWEIPYFYRAAVHQTMKNYDDAILDYTKAIQLNNKMTDAYYNRAEIILSRKDIENPNIEKAVEDLKCALELDENFKDALFAMASAQKKLGNYQLALEYLDKLLKLDPDAVFARALKKLILQKYVK
ncbi:MAG: tetratricopeptide repeat protein [Cyanobacteria bacterium SIG30]|nr:tetratricopeptide repeat protein [Cyanobacteria bacterium SIG30]